MSNEKSSWDQSQVLYGLRLLLEKHRSTRKFYSEFKDHLDPDSSLQFSYSQFTRYLKGETKLNPDKLQSFKSYILKKVQIVPDLVIPRIAIDIQAQPIQVDLTELLSSPPALNFLAYFLSNKEILYDKFDVILTHSEAVPLAIGFSMILNIPWYSISFRPPSTKPEQIFQYPYLIDQELVSTLYFNRRFGFTNKRVLIINDYVRKGGLLDTLFRVVEDNNGEVSYLLALIGIGSLWRSVFTELSGHLKVLYLLDQ